MGDTTLPNLTVYGLGKMGTGIAEILTNNFVLTLYDHNFNKTELLSKKLHARMAKNPKEALQDAQVLLLAIKPQDFPKAAVEIAPILDPQQVVISILAGTPLSLLKQLLATQHLVRATPNMPSIYGKGIIGLTKVPSADEKDKQLAQQVFNPLGKTFWLPETEIDALTALAGSGPAFIFVLLEATIEAGLAMGLSLELAKTVALETLVGSLEICKKEENIRVSLNGKLQRPQAAPSLV
jgi:pyrroline-5-carboxylate reductase